MSKTILEYWSSSAEQDQFGQRKPIRVQRIIEDEIPMQQQQQQQQQQQPIQTFSTGGYIQLQAAEPAAQPPIYHPSPMQRPAHSTGQITALAALAGLIALFMGIQVLALQSDNAKLSAENQALKEMAQILRR